MLSPEQKAILSRSGLGNGALTEAEIDGIVDGTLPVEKLDDAALLEFLNIANALYRGGMQLISDAAYDFIFLAELKRRHPTHPYLRAVEPEAAFAGKTVDLPVRMLSTDKAYSVEEIERWLERIRKAADELDIDFQSLTFRVTPKLDGFAAYDDGVGLYTRGDGRRGTDISRVFERGLAVGGNGKRGQGAGEIVVARAYFEAHLAARFENARNFQASIIREKTLDEQVEQAILNRAALFFPFSQLPAWECDAAKLLENFETIKQQAWGSVDFDVDGIVIEVTDEHIQHHMGSTRHHHRWQIAYKSNVESAEVRVLAVTPQTSRSGRVNPVAELHPTRLSGALISRATAHHYGMVKEQGIGPGTLIELTRSGLVIPKIERVLEAAPPQIPDRCPSCGTELVWESDYLYCPNSMRCPAQIENSIEHFFTVLGNIDGFGAKTIHKLYENGVRSVYEIYMLDEDRFRAMGFGDKTSRNLVLQLTRSRTERIEDWRFLGAFGIYRMGLGNCERLLRHHTLTSIFDLTVEDIVKIEGFAELTAKTVVKCLKDVKDDFFRLYSLGYNLEPTPVGAPSESVAPSRIAGKLIVFTGAMTHGTREEMTREAKRLGAKVGNAVTGKTDYLVTGENVGETKIKSAKEKGVSVISEDAYLEMLRGAGG